MNNFLQKIIQIIFVILILSVPAMSYADRIEDDIISGKFNNAYNTMVKGDEARDQYDLLQAIEFYQKALDFYSILSKKYPNNQRGIVKFRIAYCDNQIETLLKKLEKKTRKNHKVENLSKSIKTQDQTKKTINILKLESIKSKAKYFLKEGTPLKADDILIEGMKIDPSDSTIRLLTGMQKCQVGKFEDALPVLQLLTKEYPSNTTAHLALACSYLGLNSFELAKEEIQNALNIDPNIPEAHYNMAQILLFIQPVNINKARSHYKKSLLLGGKPDKTLQFLIK